MYSCLKIQFKIRSVVETIFHVNVNIVNFGSLKVKCNPCLITVAVNWSESVKFAN